MKCSEVLKYIAGLGNKVSNIIRRHTDKMNLLLYVFYDYYILSSFLGSLFNNGYKVVFLSNTLIFVFLLLYLCILILLLCIFIRQLSLFG